MDGDLKKIRIVGEYMIEVWKAAGMNMDNVEFLWASDEINRRADDYWLRVMDIATKFNLSRMKRCCTIMGRSVGVELLRLHHLLTLFLPASQLLPPLILMACNHFDHL